MAASMVGSRLRQKVQILFNISVRKASSDGYYVLLPEVPDDTAENNPVMRTDNFPSFTEIKPQNCMTGCAKLAIQYDVGLGKHVEELKDIQCDKTFEKVFEPLERLSLPLNTAWRTLKNLNYLQGGNYRSVFQRIHPQVERARNERWVSEALYNAAKEVNADSGRLTEQQQQLVQMYLLEGRLNGVELSGPKRQQFLTVLSHLAQGKTHFRNRVMISQNLFSHIIEDYGQIVDLPTPLVNLMSVNKTDPSRGPWKLTLNQTVSTSFLENCPQRMLRWNLWQAMSNVASLSQDEVNLSNHLLIKEIRTHRSDIAHLLGFDNYADMSMETKMAGSVENVLNMIESLKSHFLPSAHEEIARLQDFAAYEGFRDQIQMWDLPYWRRRQRKHVYKIDSSDVAQYFPLPRVLDGLFSICDKLFGITIKESSDDVDRWDNSVKFFNIHDSHDDSYIGSFYLDPYSRSSQKLAGAWVEAGREKSMLLGISPYSYMNLNLTPPLANRPCLLTLEEVNTLFYNFGHNLQQLLTRVQYSEISGQRNLTWDSLHTCAMVMSLILNHPSVLRGISGHYDTNEPVPDDLMITALEARRHMASYDKMRQLYFSAFDMEMYISETAWKDVKQNMWESFMPIPLSDEDNHPCSMTAIFSDQYAAAYYSMLWAEMLAIDIFKAFDEAGLDNLDNAGAVGRRFRDTFLSLGGGVAASEVFRRFRGRDPSQHAMFEYYGVGDAEQISRSK